MKVLNNLKKIYSDNQTTLKSELGVDNVMMLPRITKVVINSGVGRLSKESEKVDEVFASIKSITGQLPVMTKSRLSIAGFKVRENQEIGVKVTLRGQRMWDFLDRLINSALPRVRDSQGLSLKAIDNSGNLNIGIKEHTIFPEIVAEDVRNIFGFQITVVLNSGEKVSAEKLYRKLGFPLKKAA